MEDNNESNLVNSIIIQKDENKDMPNQNTLLLTNTSFELDYMNSGNNENIQKIGQENDELKSINKSLMNSLDSAKKECEEYKYFKDKYEKLLLDYSNKFHSKEPSIDVKNNIDKELMLDKDKQIENYKEEINKLTQEKETLIKSNNDDIEKLNKLIKENQDLQKKIIDLENKKDKLNESWEKKEKILKENLEKAKINIKLLEENISKIQEYEIQISKLKEENESILKEKEEINYKLESANNTIQTQNGEKENHSKLLNEYQEKITLYENDMKNMFQKIDEKEREIEKLKTEIEILKTERNEFEERFSDMKNTLEEKEEEINRLSNENQTMNTNNYSKKFSVDETNNNSKFLETDELSEFFTLNTNLIKIFIKLYDSFEMFIKFSNEMNMNINAFNSIKFNLSKDYSPNIQSFKGYVESIMAPFIKIEESITNIAENIDLNKISDYLMKKEKYFRCINCEKLKRPQEMRKTDCNCYICVEHLFTKFDLNFHKRKVHYQI